MLSRDAANCEMKNKIARILAIEKKKLRVEADMAAHIRTALTAVNLSIPVHAGELALGTWQGIYLWEHRTHPHTRRIALHFIGE